VLVGVGISVVSALTDTHNHRTEINSSARGACGVPLR
jgi:hypothetical protein